MSAEAETFSIAGIMEAQLSVLTEIKNTQISMMSPTQMARYFGTEGAGGGKDAKKSSAALGLVTTKISAMIGPMALLGRFLQGFLEPLEMIAEPFEVFGEILSQLLYPIIIPINEQLYKATPYLEKFVVYAVPVVDFFFRTTSIFGIMIDKGATLRATLEPIIVHVTAFGNALAPVGRALVSVGEGLINFPTAFGIAITTFVTNLGTTIVTYLSDGFVSVINWFKSIPQMIFNALKDAGEDFKEWLKDLIEEWFT